MTVLPAIVIILIVFMVHLVLLPFRMVSQSAYDNPKRTARMVLGAAAGWGVAYLFGLPYEIQLSVSGGALAWVLDKVFA